VLQALALLRDSVAVGHHLVIGYLAGSHHALYSIVLGFLEDFYFDNLPLQLWLDQH